MQPTRSSLVEVIKSAVTEKELRESVVYIMQGIKAGETVKINRKMITVEAPGILFFVDLEPKANWSHKCRYLLINTDGVLQLKEDGQYPPETEKLQVFLKSPDVENWMLLTDNVYE